MKAPTMDAPPEYDLVDREIGLVRTGRPHNPAIAHISGSHGLPGTADYLLNAAIKNRKDPETVRILRAIRSHRDGDPTSPTFGCFKWYAEDPAVHDTNAAFFVCAPLAALWLGYRDRLVPAEIAELRDVFADVLPWFRHMAESPSFFYPNKCISDAALLLAAGHILENEADTAAGRTFCLRYFDYYVRRGTGWGEDHSPVYSRIIVEMTLLIMAFEQSGRLHDEAKRMTDAILDWVAFHDGMDAVPSIRGYNFECRPDAGAWAARLLSGEAQDDAPDGILGVGIAACGYRYDPKKLDRPRQARWRTFDDHFSTSYIGAHARLGTLSHLPLMSNSYQHDDWGLGWQCKPCAFIVDREEYGVLEWLTQDDEGVVRRHQAESYHDWPSRHLFKRLSFHPDVEFIGHQDGGAAIVFREIHRLHSPTRRLVDRWRLAKGSGRLLVDGHEASGEVPPSRWLVLDYGACAVAIRALSCRIPQIAVDDENLPRRTVGCIVQPSLQIEREQDETHLNLVLVDQNEGVLTEPLLFSGWCVVLLDRAADVAGLRVEEVFRDDGEIPRTNGELIRTATLTTPTSILRLERDMLTGTDKRWIDGQPFAPRIAREVAGANQVIGIPLRRA